MCTSDNVRFRFTKNIELDLNFYQLPIFLFDDDFLELPNDSKVLFAIIKNQYNLSIRYNWFDDENFVYCELSLKEMCKLMNRTDKTITKAINMLKKFDLIEIQNGGFGKKRRVYLKYKNYETSSNKDYSKDRLYYSKNDVMSNVFHPLLKKLFTEDRYKTMSNDAKILYSVLRSRHNLSFENTRAGNTSWTNQSNHVFFKFSRENMQSIIGKSKNTITKIMKELIFLNLIQEEWKQRDTGKLLYLTFSSDELNDKKVGIKKLSTGDKPSKNTRVGKIGIQSRKNWDTRVGKIGIPESEKLGGSNTNFNNTNHSNNDMNDMVHKSSLVLSEKEENETRPINHSHHAHNTYKKLIEKKVELEFMKNFHYEDDKKDFRELCDIFVDIIVNNMLSTKRTIWINRTEVSRQTIRDKFDEIDNTIFMFAINQYIEYKQRGEIRKPEQYILSCLYNAFIDSKIKY